MLLLLLRHVKKVHQPKSEEVVDVAEEHGRCDS